MTMLSTACVVTISISLKLCLYVVPFLRYMYSASKNGVTLKLGGGRGRSRSLKMAPFDRSYTGMTFYRSAIVSIAVCCTILTGTI